jgi:hypothetical protein
MWDIFITGFGPMKALAASLDSSRHTVLEREFVPLHERYRTPAGRAVRTAKAEWPRRVEGKFELRGYLACR